MKPELAARLGPASCPGDASADAAALARQRLFELLQRQRGTAGAAIPLRPGTAPARLSFAQEGLWFVDRLEGNSPAYNSARAWRLEGSLDPTTLERSLQALIARHEILRTAFEQRDGSPVPVIHPAGSAQVELAVQPIERAVHDDEPTLAGYVRTAAAEPFDLARAPLMRARLWRVSGTEHVLLLVVHHIVFDGWSMGVLTRELGALYDSSGDPAALPPLAIQFADYALWQRERLASEALQRQLSYWRGQLHGAATLDLPADHPRPARISYRGAIERITLPPPLAAQLQALAQRENATLFMLLLAAFQVLLMRHARQHDIAVGVPVAGRQRAELEGLIGCFVNTLVMRSDLSANPPFTELLAQVRQTALDAYLNQELPFDHLVAELSPQRDLARNPLYQVSFALNNQPTSALQFEGIRARALELPHASSKFDLSMALCADGDSLHGSIEYSSDLFDAGRIARLAVQWRVLLEAIVADPARRIAQLPLLDDAERQRMLHAWNPPAPVVGASDACLHELIEAQVRRSPDAIATVWVGQSMRYGELDARANRLARHLRGLGVAPEVLVGVCLERSASTLVAMLGILKAGGTCVPLDPDQPSARLAFMLDDCAAPLVVTQQSLRERLAASRARIVCLDRDVPAIASNEAHSLPALARPEHLACVIYTSGSTGQPKGVQVTHSGVAHHLRWFTGAVGVVPADRFLFKTSIGFDASIVELFAPLLVGASVVIADAHGERDMGLLAQTLSRHAITVLQMVPSVLRALLAQPSFEPPDSLRFLVCGGEALDRELARELRRRWPAVALGNFYGPTEASIDATWHPVHEVAAGLGTVTIGRPVSHARCHVLDEHLQPVPIGVVGELCIGGAGLARGYLHRAELTAQRFIADPFRPGERLYRSGDLARYLADGNIEWMGRIDEQVKLRGLRIELGEIEAALRACDGVRDAAVLLREDRPGFPRLVGYAQSDTALPAALRDRLAERLPEHMLPSSIVVLPALPLLPSGKLDRRALPAPDAAVRRGDDAAPGSPLEVALAQIWCELLGLQRVGVDDDFFALGGHSLLAVRVLAEIERRIGPTLRVSNLFQARSIRRLAALLQSAGDGAAATSCVVALQPLGSRPPLFAVSGYGGGVMPFMALASELGTDQPLSVLDTGVFDGASDDLTLEDVARRLVADMRRVQGSGPYRLVGYSLGGKVVYEMAQQLRRMDERVDLLVLLDCAGPGYPRRAAFPERALLHLRHSVALGPWAAARYLVKRMWNLRKYLATTQARLFDSDSAGMAPAQSMQRSADAVDRAWRRYLPRFYAGEAVLVRAELRPSHVGLITEDPLMGWGPLVGAGVRLEGLHCGHRDMLNPEHAAALARVLARYLNEPPRA